MFFASAPRKSLATLLFAAGALVMPSESEAAIYNLYATTVAGIAASEQVTITSDPDGSGTSAVSSTAIYATPQGAINYLQGGPGSIGLGSSGSGTYTRLYAMQQTSGNMTTERGYNASDADGTNTTPQNSQIDWQQKTGVGFPIVTVSELTFVTYNSVEYFEILFDGQENENAVSLDELLVFTAPGRIDISEAFESANPDPSLAAIIGQFESQGATLRYSLDDLDINHNIVEDNAILFETSTGSGAGEVGFYIPINSITNLRNGNLLTNGAAENDRVYLWIQHGGIGMLGGINFGTSATFEEWAYFRSGVPLENLLPEPSTTLGGLLIAAGALFTRRRRHQLA